MSKSMKQQFADWVRTQSGPYDYQSIVGCAFAQFLRANGYASNPRVDEPWEGGPLGSWSDNKGPTHDLPPGVDDAVKAEPWTFEALAERLAEAGC